MESQVAIRQQNSVQTLDSMAITPAALAHRKAMIKDVMKAVMVPGVHYGTIPGCGPKPTLLKSGAEAILSTFQLAPRCSINKVEMPSGQREYEVTCSLYALDGAFLGEGVGTASTLEGKWKRPNPADVYNTVLKMAKKRALVDATLTVTGASDMFTQDIEEMTEPGLPAHGKKMQGAPAPVKDFTAPAGMDDMNHADPGPAPDPINVDGLAGFLKGVADLGELEAEYKTITKGPRWAVSDQAAINAVFNARKAAFQAQ